MIHIEQAVIVEGKYDKIKLESIIDAVIIQTNGFAVFKDNEKMALIKHFANTNGIIILTDSDMAGFKIRNYLKGTIENDKITNVYIPDIFGKEKRKLKPSKEGKLGVEGINKDIIIDAFIKAGIIFSDKVKTENKISRLDLYNDGFSGTENSSQNRRILLKYLNLPELLTTASLLEVLNSMFTYEDYKNTVQKIFYNRGDN